MPAGRRQPSEAVRQAVYSQDVLTVSPATLRWLDHSWRNLCDYTQSTSPAELPAASIQQWHHELLQSVSPTTANNYLRAVKIVMRRLGRDSAEPVPYAPEEPHTPEAVTVDSYRALLSVAGVRDAAILSLLWGSGCRVGEIPTMTTDTLDIWHENGRTRLAVAVTGKYHRRRNLSHATRYVYADGPEAAAVARYMHDRDCRTCSAVFTNQGGGKPISANTIRSALRLLQRKAGAPDPCNPHAFRHAFAYRKRQEGYPLEWISEWLGHADPAFTARMYGDKTEKEIRYRYFAPPPSRQQPERGRQE